MYFFLLAKCEEASPGSAGVVTGLATHVVLKSMLEPNKPEGSNKHNCPLGEKGEPKRGGVTARNGQRSVFIEEVNV